MEKDQNNKLPLVSIFAICQNHGKYLIETLDSIKAQTYPYIQIIIIDNFSSDESVELITNWIKINNCSCEFIKNSEQLPLAKNCNMGLSKVKGKYFQGISCDDSLVAEKIEKQVTLFESLNEKYACIYGDALRIDENSKLLKEESIFSARKQRFQYTAMPQGNLKFELQRMTFISAPTVLFRTNAIKDIGGYNPEFYVEDWPLYIALSQGGYLFFPLDEISAYYRIHNQSIDQQRIPAYYKSLLKTYEYFYYYFDLKDSFIRGKWFNYLMQYRKNGLTSALSHFFKYNYYTGNISFKKSLKFIIN